MMRPWLKRGLLLLAFIFLIATALLLQTVFFKPIRLHWFFQKTSILNVLEQPEMMSYLRLLDNYGLAFYRSKLDEYSPLREKQEMEQFKRDFATFNSYDASDLSGQEKVSHEIFNYNGRMELEGERWRHHDFPLNQMFGIQSNLPNFMVNIHSVTNESEAKDYISRLTLFREKFEQVIARLKLREAAGVYPPRFTIEKVVAQMRGVVAKEPKQNLLYVSFQEKLDKIPAAKLSQEQRAVLLAQAEQAVSSSVRPGYQQLIAYFDGLKVKATSNDGVWRLPDGEAYYAYRVRQQTTTEMTPAQLHQIGLDEVARLSGEMDAILRANGAADGSLGKRMLLLAQRPDQLYPDSDAGRAQILKDYQTIIDKIDAGLGPYFAVKPKTGVVVKRVPPFAEKTAPGAYYDGPSFDGARPGTFFANLRNMADIPKFGMHTLAYHEAIPGHHFQIGIQQELDDLPLFRRFSNFTAYAEGWALYAERLAWESGFEPDPLDNLGRLQAEMFRSVRLVVDTGLHYKRWSREQAIAYMMENTGMAEGEVTAEIERYLVAPAQALAYKAGMMKILELRERARQQLGDKFKLRDFHDVVLKNGATPLGVLEKLVDAWIAQQKAA